MWSTFQAYWPIVVGICGGIGAVSVFVRNALDIQRIALTTKKLRIEIEGLRKNTASGNTDGDDQDERQIIIPTLEEIDRLGKTVEDSNKSSSKTVGFLALFILLISSATFTESSRLSGEIEIRQKLEMDRDELRLKVDRLETQIRGLGRDQV